MLAGEEVYVLLWSDGDDEAMNDDMPRVFVRQSDAREALHELADEAILFEAALLHSTKDSFRASNGAWAEIRTVEVE